MVKDIKYTMESHEGDLPKRGSRKSGSKYDTPLNEFIESEQEQAKFVFEGEVANADAQYFRNQIKKRIDARELADEIEVSTIGTIVYIAKK